MPVTKQATKKVRQDARKALYNSRVRKMYKKAVVNFRTKPTTTGLTSAYSALDTAAKTNVIHKNKASRLKSRLSKLIASAKPPAKKTAATA